MSVVVVIIIKAWAFVFVFVSLILRSDVNNITSYPELSSSVKPHHFIRFFVVPVLAKRGKNTVRTVWHTFILDFKVFVGSRTRVGENVWSSHNCTLCPVVASGKHKKMKKG